MLIILWIIAILPDRAANKVIHFHRLCSKILDLRATDDPRDIVHRSVQALVEGHVVGVPTETVYGLAANALCEHAVEQLCEIKGRQANVPLAISVGSREAADDFICQMTPLARRLSYRCWPGPLTLVVPCDSPLSAVTQLPGGGPQADYGRVRLRRVSRR